MARRFVLSLPHWIPALAALVILATSCGEGRFPVCKSNDECALRLEDAGAGPKVCYNLRCVECRYDTDCPSGKVCNAALSECKDITTRTEDAEEKARDKKGDGAAGGAKTWDECAATCKDSDCIHACDQRFRK